MASFKLFLKNRNVGDKGLYFKFFFKEHGTYKQKDFFTLQKVPSKIWEFITSGKESRLPEFIAFKTIYRSLIGKETALNNLVNLVNLELNSELKKDTPEYVNRILERAYEQNLLIKVEKPEVEVIELVAEPIEEKDLMYHFDEYIKLCKAGKINTQNGNKKGIKLTSNTITKRTAHCESFRLFFEETKTQIPTLNTYTNDLVDDFRDWHIEEKENQNTYINKITQTFCNFFRWAIDEKLTKNTEFLNLKSLSEFKADENIFTITPVQLRKFIEFKPVKQSAGDHTELYRDIFIFSCGVALRIGDIQRLKVGRITRNNDVYSLAFTTEKTLTKVTVPLPKFAVEIYLKYSKGKNGDDLLFGTGWHRQHYNDGIKEIGRELGFTNIVEYIVMKGSEVIREEKQLWEVMSSHIARKTCITTLLLMDVPEADVRLLSGHSPTSKSFYRYVDIAKDWKKDIKILKGWASFYLETNESSKNLLQKIS